MTKVKSKIQRLLRDLDLQNGSGDVLVSSITTDDGVLPTADHPESAAESDGDLSDVTTEPDHELRFKGAAHGTSKEKVVHLENRILQLMHDNKAMQLRYEQHIKTRDAEIAELRGHLSTAIKDMEERQKEVESRAPIFKLKVEDFRERLKDLKISDAQYSELKHASPQNVHALDEVKIAVYEATAELRKENERLRLGITTARDTAARAEEEAAKHR